MDNNKIDFLVFGATGMQGSIVVRDLVENGYRIFISGRNQSVLENVNQKYAVLGSQPVDLNNKEEIINLVKKIRPAVIINCAEGDWNLNVYEAALRGGSHVLDLGSDIPTTKIQLASSDEFKKQNLIAITGCGSTPGINNVMLSYATEFLDHIHTIEAGFAWNSNIKTFVVPFSMASIIEEFTEPAPVIESGKWLEKIPLYTIEDKEFREVGMQKNFLVRHPETETFFSNYRGYGLQNMRFYAGFPEHSFNKILSYISNRNFDGRNGVYIESKGLVPLISLTKTLQEMYPPPPDYLEKENLWVSINGLKNGEKKNLMMECIVPTLPDWKEMGCNIDTGFPASIMGQMILNGNITQYGSFAPESVVPHEKFFNVLNEKGMMILMNGSRVNLKSEVLL